MRLIYFLLAFFVLSLFNSPTTNAQNLPPLSCKVHTFLVDNSYTLPFKYDSPELVSGSNVKNGDSIVYLFEVANNTGRERVTINKVTMTHVRPLFEPIEIIQTQAHNGSCSSKPLSQIVTCESNYSFGESAHYPIEYLLRIDNPKNYPNTSSSFYIETDAGSASCASMLFIKDQEKINPINWETPFAKLSSSNFYIRTGEQKFYGKDPITITSGTGTENSTIESIWNENGVEMRLFAYFRKIPNNMWEMYELRTYNGNSNGDWIYYKESLGNSISSLINYRYYGSEIKFVPTDGSTNAEIYCKDCQINAFIPQTPPISSQGYSLQALIGLPKDKIITLSTNPNSGYGVNVLLTDSQRQTVLDQSDFIYEWTTDYPNIVEVTVGSINSQNGTCIYGINPPCPKTHIDLKGLTPGEALITAKVKRISDNVEIARVSFPVKVTSVGGSIVKIEDSEMQRIKEDLAKVTKELESQKSQIKETQGTLQKIVNFFRKFFGKFFKL